MMPTPQITRVAHHQQLCQSIGSAWRRWQFSGRCQSTIPCSSSFDAVNPSSYENITVPSAKGGSASTWSPRGQRVAVRAAAAFMLIPLILGVIRLGIAALELAQGGALFGVVGIAQVLAGAGGGMGLDEGLDVSSGPGDDVGSGGDDELGASGPEPPSAAEARRAAAFVEPDPDSFGDLGDVGQAALILLLKLQSGLLDVWSAALSGQDALNTFQVWWEDSRIALAIQLQMHMLLAYYMQIQANGSAFHTVAESRVVRWVGRMCLTLGRAVVKGVHIGLHPAQVGVSSTSTSSTSSTCTDSASKTSISTSNTSTGSKPTNSAVTLSMPTFATVSNTASIATTVPAIESAAAMAGSSDRTASGTKPEGQAGPLLPAVPDTAMRVALGLTTCAAISSSMASTSVMPVTLVIASHMLTLVQVLAAGLYMWQGLSPGCDAFFRDHRDSLIKQVVVLVAARAAVEAVITREALNIAHLYATSHLGQLEISMLPLRPLLSGAVYVLILLKQSYTPAAVMSAFFGLLGLGLWVVRSPV